MLSHHFLLVKWLPSGKRLHNYGKIHHFSWDKSLFRLGHFPVRFLFVITRGYITIKSHGKSHQKPPFSYGFPMVFLWFLSLPVRSTTEPRSSGGGGRGGKSFQARPPWPPWPPAMAMAHRGGLKFAHVTWKIMVVIYYVIPIEMVIYP